MIIEEKDRKNKYKKFKKYIDNKDAIIETDPINELEEAFIKAFNEKEVKKRYEFIYDYMCKYLDNNVCILCDFKNDKCTTKHFRLFRAYRLFRTKNRLEEKGNWGWTKKRFYGRIQLIFLNY